MKSILDRSFKYTPSVATDLRKTFARVRRELSVQAKAEAHSRDLTLVPLGKSLARGGA